MTSGLTPRMAQCVAAIRKLSADGVAPSITELQAELRVTNRGQVHALLCDLKDRGAIDWTPKARRSLRIIERPSIADLAKLDDGLLRDVRRDIDDLLYRRSVARLTAGEGRAA